MDDPGNAVLKRRSVAPWLLRLRQQRHDDKGDVRLAPDFVRFTPESSRKTRQVISAAFDPKATFADRSPVHAHRVDSQPLKLGYTKLTKPAFLKSWYNLGYVGYRKEGDANDYA